MKLHVILFVVAVCATTKVYGENLDQYYGTPEEECSRAGGRCILKSECEEGHLAKPNLCPKQRSSGFECCHGIPKSENRCHKLGGECFDKNYCKNPSQRATDCGVGKECCILL